MTASSSFSPFAQPQKNEPAGYAAHPAPSKNVTWIPPRQCRPAIYSPREKAPTPTAAGLPRYSDLRTGRRPDTGPAQPKRVRPARVPTPAVKITPARNLRGRRSDGYTRRSAPADWAVTDYPTASTVGRTTLKIDPCGIAADAQRRPPCASTIERQRGRPNPIPSGLVVK